jgi:enoyl-CoA hydratase/carnithine racemase
VILVTECRSVYRIELRVIPRQQLAAADRFARPGTCARSYAIVASSPLTVGLGKEAFYAQIELDEHRAYDLTKAVMAMNARADDAQEGMCAFLEKLPATWRRR